jgi:hypothetical protein
VDLLVETDSDAGQTVARDEHHLDRRVPTLFPPPDTLMVKGQAECTVSLGCGEINGL